MDIKDYKQHPGHKRVCPQCGRSMGFGMVLRERKNKSPIMVSARKCHGCGHTEVRAPKQEESC